MAKVKHPSEVNTRHVRVYVGDIEALKETAKEFNVTIADVVNELISANPLTSGVAKLSDVSPNQIPMTALLTRLDGIEAKLAEKKPVNEPLTFEAWVEAGKREGFLPDDFKFVCSKCGKEMYRGGTGEWYHYEEPTEGPAHAATVNDDAGSTKPKRILKLTYGGVPVTLSSKPVNDNKGGKIG